MALSFTKTVFSGSILHVTCFPYPWPHGSVAVKRKKDSKPHLAKLTAGDYNLLVCPAELHNISGFFISIFKIKILALFADFNIQSVFFARFDGNHNFFVWKPAADFPENFASVTF